MAFAIPHRFWITVFPFLFVSGFLKISSLISSETYLLFDSILFTLHVLMALIQPRVLELPCAAGVALKRRKKKKKTHHLQLFSPYFCCFFFSSRNLLLFYSVNGCLDLLMYLSVSFRYFFLHSLTSSGNGFLLPEMYPLDLYLIRSFDVKHHQLLFDSLFYPFS